MGSLIDLESSLLDLPLLASQLHFLKYILFIYVLIYYFWLCWVFFAVRGLSRVVVHWPFVEMASCMVEHGLYSAWASVVVALQLWSTGSIVVVHGRSCPVARGIFPDQGTKPRPLHWQADS